MSTQGPLPSPISLLDSTAEGYDKKCFKYLMLSPDGEMMCRDNNGNIVATTAEKMLLTGNYVCTGGLMLHMIVTVSSRVCVRNTLFPVTKYFYF